MAATLKKHDLLSRLQNLDLKTMELRDASMSTFARDWSSVHPGRPGFEYGWRLIVWRVVSQLQVGVIFTIWVADDCRPRFFVSSKRGFIQ